MPFGDRTGPLGLGPRTGRGAGFCSGFPAPGSMNPYGRFGFSGWGGRGRGWRNWFYATGLTGWQRAGAWPWLGTGFPAGPPENELALLKGQAGQLQSVLENIQKRIDELEAKARPQES